MLLSKRSSDVRLVKLDKVERSEIELLLTLPLPDTHSSPKSSLCRLIAYSSPVKSRISLFCALRRGKVDISPLVIVAPIAFLSAVSIAARRLASGMLTGVGSTSTGGGVGSNLTVTPRSCSAGMCVLSDVLLSGLFCKSKYTRPPLPNPVFATSGEMSEMLLS